MVETHLSTTPSGHLLFHPSGESRKQQLSRIEEESERPSEREGAAIEVERRLQRVLTSLGLEIRVSASPPFLGLLVCLVGEVRLQDAKLAKDVTNLRASLLSGTVPDFPRPRLLVCSSL